VILRFLLFRCWFFGDLVWGFGLGIWFEGFFGCDFVGFSVEGTDLDFISFKDELAFVNNVY
jgi:hypothetical protein